MYDLILWSGTENFVVLFCGSIPPLKPLWDRARAKGGILASLHISRGGTQHTEDYSLIERNGVGMKGGVGVGVSTMEGSKGSLVSRA